MMKYKKGYTLAEVLITLSLLGVISAIALSSITQIYKKNTTLAKLKMAYSTLERATVNMKINSGCFQSNISCTGLTGTTKPTDDNDINKTKKFIKLTGINGKVVSASAPYPYYMYCIKQACSEKAQADGIYLYYYIKTNQGINYSIRTSQFSKGNTTYYPISVYVITDTKRNAKLILGKNVFLFIIYDDFRVEPGVFGAGSTINPMSKPKDNSDINTYCSYSKKLYGGGSCAARIMKAGWKINY